VADGSGVSVGADGGGVSVGGDVSVATGGGVAEGPISASGSAVGIGVGPDSGRLQEARAMAINRADPTLFMVARISHLLDASARFLLIVRYRKTLAGENLGGIKAR
jgi:hypothetical protein